MALKYVFRNDPIGEGTRAVWAGEGVFGKQYTDGPVGQAFSNDINSFRESDGLVIDATGSRVGLVRSGILTWIAGVFGATGYRDGPGNQALFAFGASGYMMASAAMTSPTVGYVSEGYNQAIRKLEQQPDGSWNVSTFYRGNLIVFCFDSLGNMWFQDGTNLLRLAPDGTKSSVPAVRQRSNTGIIYIWSMCADKIGNVYFHDNINAASVFYKCGQDMTIHHVCGIDQVEWDQILTSKLPVPQDGDKDHCSFFHDSVMMASDDGTELYMTGGDENYIRRFKDGQSTTLGIDGYWHQFAFRSSADVKYLINFAGAGWDDPIKRSLLVSVPNYIPTFTNTWRAFKALDLVESSDPPIDILSAEFTEWDKLIFPTKVVAGQPCQFSFAFANGCDRAWTKAGGFHCIWYDNAFSAPTLELDDNETVAPQAIRRFNLTAMAPQTPGIYLQRPCMAQGSNWFYGLGGGNIQVFATQAELDASTQPQGGTMQITNVSMTPSVVSGENLVITVTVVNNGPSIVNPEPPDPTKIWNEGDAILDTAATGSWRIGVDYDGRPSTQIAYPYRWGLDAPLNPGDSRTLQFPIKLTTAGTKNYWVGLVQEHVAWVQENLGKTAVNVAAVAPPPPPPPTTVTIPPGTYSFTGTLTSADGTTNGTITATITVANPQPVPGTVTLQFTKL